MKSNRIASIIIESNRELGESFQVSFYVGIMCTHENGIHIIGMLLHNILLRGPLFDTLMLNSIILVYNN